MVLHRLWAFTSFQMATATYSREAKIQKFTLQRDLPASSHFTKCFQSKENTPIMQKTLISSVMARFMPLSDITSLDERIFPYLTETLKVQCNHQIEQNLKVSSVLFLCSVAKLCVGSNILEVNFLHISRESNIVDLSIIECVDSSSGF